MIVQATAASSPADWWTPTANVIVGVIALGTALFNIFGPGLARKWFGTSPDEAAARAERSAQAVENALSRTFSLVETKLSGIDNRLGDVSSQLSVLLDRTPREPQNVRQTQQEEVP